MPRVVSVRIGDRAYPVRLEAGGPEGVAACVDAARIALVTDSNVGPLWADRVAAAFRARGTAVAIHEFPAGEGSKTLATWSALVAAIVGAGVDRRTPVVALGGGVVGDLAGFAAACALRGLPLVQVPTTVLAMVDSSVGGKTAVDLPFGKNLIGAFHHPTLVYAGLGALATLPAEERVAGLGEVVKTAVLGDAALLDALEAQCVAVRAGDLAALLPIIARCVEVKAAIVERDPDERGDRGWLNLGHTVGHALEAASGYALRHGEAVAIGTIAEIAWATREGLCADPDLAARVARICASLGLPIAPSPYDRARALGAMRLDKKAAGDIVRVAVPVRVGAMTIADVPFNSLDALLPDP